MHPGEFVLSRLCDLYFSRFQRRVTLHETNETNVLYEQCSTLQPAPYDDDGFIKQRSTLFSPIQRPFLGTDWNHSVYSLINDEMLWSVIQARLIEEETSYGTSSPTANYPPRSINFALEGQSSPLWIPTLRRKGISSILIHRWLAILISSFAGILSGKSVLGNFRVITLYSSGRLTVQIISCKDDVLRPFVSASFTCIVISIIRNYWFCLFDLIWILKAEIFLNSWNCLIYVYNK